MPVNREEVAVSEQALSDVKVLDLTWYIAGPYCTKLLADYGADVIKVERPGTGDPARSMGPFLGDEPHPERSGLFTHLNTNKRSITLNLKNAAGKKLFKQLLKDVDILVESFRPHVMPGLGLGYEVLKELNPRLVMASLSSFGQTGPYQEFKASDIVEYAMGGPMYCTGLLEREPVKMGGTVTTTIGGNVAAPFILGALWAARVHGIAQHVDISLFQVQLGQVERRPYYFMNYAYTGTITGRGEAGGVFGVPFAIYPCKDGYVQIITAQHWWPRVARMLNRPEILTDPRFAEYSDRLQHREEFENEFLLPWLLSRSKWEVTQAAQREKEPVLPVCTAEDMVMDPHFKQRGFFVDIEHPVLGKLKYPGAPVKLGEGSWVVRWPAPLLGQHNAEVYGALGYSKQDQVRLREIGAI